MTYEEFINNILNTRGRFSCGNEYHERHHILPRCMGGPDDDDNLIDLYACEHFIAHKLLAQENSDNDKLIYAWWMMSHVKDKNQQRVEVTPEEYEEARNAFSKSMSGENSPNYGKHRSEETRRKISEGQKNRPPISEETRKKISDAGKRRVVSDETRKKLSELRKGEKHYRYGTHLSEELKKKLSEAHKGKTSSRKGIPCSEETKKKLSEANMGRKWTEEQKQNLKNIRKDKFSGADHPMARKIVQYDTNNNFICIWNYALEAEKETGIGRSNISSCCRGKRKTTGGFKWYYLYDQTDKDGSIIQGAISLGLITEEKALIYLSQQNNLENQ